MVLSGELNSVMTDPKPFPFIAPLKFKGGAAGGIESRLNDAASESKPNS